MLLVTACEELTSRPPMTPDFQTVGLSTDEKAGAPVDAIGQATDDTLEDGDGPVGVARQPVVAIGEGRRLGNQPRRRPVETDGGEVILNFVDAEIEEVARAILADTLGLNYIIDPSIGGTVTLHTSRPMSLEELPPLLESVLQLNGAALVADGDLYRIVPIANAATSGLVPAVTGPARRSQARAIAAGHGLQVVPLRYVSAVEIETVLKPFLPAGGVAQVDPTRNLLLLSGPPEQVSTVLDLIELFDVDWLAGMSFALYPLASAEAETMVTELEAIFAGGSEKALAGILRFVPIPRLQAVMAISPEPSYLRRVQRWIEELDQGLGGEGEDVHIYFVQFGDAANLAEVLRELFDGDGRTITVDSGPSLAPGLEPVSLSTDAEDDQSTRASPARRLPASLPGRSKDGEPEGIRIAADEVTNSLIIQATARDYRRIRKALEKLDVMPLQVLIEVTIAEVSLRDQLRYGLQWFFRFGGIDARLSEVDSGSAAQNFPGFSAILSSGNDVRVVLNALDSLTDVNVLSSPQLLVLDNQTARLQVGDEVPIAVQQSRSTTDADAPIVNTIEQRDTGVILEIAPRVNASGLTILEIDQQVSRVTSTTTSGIDSPTINQRRLTSAVAVHSGETVALGGLIQESANDTQSGIPVLARLPILGPLFGTKTNDVQRTELLILLTPRVLYDRDDARRITDELRNRLRQLEPFASREDGEAVTVESGTAEPEASAQ